MQSGVLIPFQYPSRITLKSNGPEGNRKEQQARVVLFMKIREKPGILVPFIEIKVKVVPHKKDLPGIPHLVGDLFRKVRNGFDPLEAEYFFYPFLEDG